MGLWHGANHTFALWGLGWGIAIALWRYYGNIFKKVPMLSWFLTMVIAFTLWVFFRAPDVDYAFLYIQTLFSFQGLGASIWIWIGILGLMALHHIEGKFYSIRGIQLLKRMNSTFYTGFSLGYAYVFSFYPRLWIIHLSILGFRMVKIVLKYLSLFAIGSVCAALIFELGLRAIEYTPAWKFLPVAEVALYGPDQNAGYTHRPNIKGVWTTENRARVSTTSYGIRSNGTADKIAGDEYYKIGIIGDSITEALQVSDHETFAAQLEKSLQNTREKIRVYNLGLAGATPAVEVARTKHYTNLLDLDVIIILEDPQSIALTLGKSDGGLPYYKKQANGDVTIERPFLESRSFKLKQSQIGDALFFLLDHSKFLTVLNARMNRGLLNELNNPFENQLQINNQTAEKIECDVNSLNIISNFMNPKNSQTARLFHAFVDDLKSIEENTSANIVFALYDTWADCPKDIEEKSRAVLTEILTKNDIAFFDLKSRLLENMKDGETLNNLRGFGKRVGGGHLNQNGHIVFSETIRQEIIKNYLDN